MAMSEFDVLSYGTIGLDRVYRIPHWPHSDISTHTSDVSEHLGGKAANTGVFLGHWGLRIAVSGTVLGTDQVGKSVRRMLRESPGIDVSLLETRADIDSMYCLIFVRPDGGRAIVGVNADSHPCSPPTVEMIKSVRCVTLDLYGGEDRVDAARLASQAGLPVVVGDLRRIDHPVIPFTTFAIASAPELRLEYPDREIKEVAHEIASKGPSSIFISDGSSPALLVTNSKNEEWFQPPVVQVVDTTGAGDALRAGVVYGLINKLPLTECVKLGVASGSLAVTQIGACTTPPRLEEVETLAKQIVSVRQE